MSAAQQERTERLQVVLPGDELAAIDDFRFKGASKNSSRHVPANLTR
jgi:hypothetical protein